MRIDLFKDRLLADDVVQVYKNFVLGSNVWFFENKGDGQGQHFIRYDEFKVYMSEHLKIHVNDIAIVGSAKLGFSLSPINAYRLFNEQSDLDIVIVSSEIFRRSWDAFLDLSQKYYIRDYSQICGNVFRRFVSLKEPDTRNLYFDEWSRRVEPCKKDLQTIFDIPNEINYRIYETWEAVQTYHCKGLETMKENLGKEQ